MKLQNDFRIRIFNWTLVKGCTGTNIQLVVLVRM